MMSGAWRVSEVMSGHMAGARRPQQGSTAVKGDGGARAEYSAATGAAIKLIHVGVGGAPLQLAFVVVVALAGRDHSGTERVVLHLRMIGQEVLHS